MGKPCLDVHLTVQSTFRVQLVKQVNPLNLPGNTVPGPLMLTFHATTRKVKKVNLSIRKIMHSDVEINMTAAVDPGLLESSLTERN